MRLAYDDEGHGALVVLLHGFPLDRTLWAPQVEALAPSHRVIVPDLRGHGESPSPGGISPIDDMADDVVELLDELGITEPIALGGLSMGGYVALSFAVRHPKRLRALILMDTRAEADSPEAAAVREALARRVEATGDVSPVVDAMLPRFFSEATRRRGPEMVAALESRMARSSAVGVVGSMRGMSTRHDRTADLGRINVPTLVMVGSDDAISPPSVARAMADRIPNATVRRDRRGRPPRPAGGPRRGQRRDPSIPRLDGLSGARPHGVRPPLARRRPLADNPPGSRGSIRVEGARS